MSEEKQTVGERIAEDWACGRLKGTVAEAIDEACAKAKAFGALAKKSIAKPTDD